MLFLFKSDTWQCIYILELSSQCGFARLGCPKLPSPGSGLECGADFETVWRMRSRICNTEDLNAPGRASSLAKGKVPICLSLPAWGAGTLSPVILHEGKVES